MDDCTSTLLVFFLLQGSFQMPEHSWLVDISEHLTEGKSTDSLLGQAQASLLGYRLERSVEGRASYKDMVSPMENNATYS